MNGNKASILIYANIMNQRGEETDFSKYQRQKEGIRKLHIYF